MAAYCVNEQSFDIILDISDEVGTYSRRNSFRAFAMAAPPFSGQGRRFAASMTSPSVHGLKTYIGLPSGPPTWTIGMVMTVWTGALPGPVWRPRPIGRVTADVKVLLSRSLCPLVAIGEKDSSGITSQAVPEVVGRGLVDDWSSSGVGGGRRGGLGALWGVGGHEGTLKLGCAGG